MNRAIALDAAAQRVPAPFFFLVSAVFHYLGPSFAVLLFARLDVPGVAWLRIASAALIFAIWRRPWRSVFDRQRCWIIVQLGAVLAAMNLFFYFAVNQLPLSTVGAIEFLGTVIVAANGCRTLRNIVALALTGLGVIAITQIRLSGQPIGFACAFANCILFMLYIILGHRIASGSVAEGNYENMPVNNIDQLGASMLVAMAVITPFGLLGALPAFSNVSLLMAGVLVGICSSVIPYVTDQLAMARLPRATFALMLSLLPVFATIIGAVVLHQIPTLADILGIVLVAAGVALHRQELK
ncbi:MAG: EamA family transporter [Vulcanimicrobiaceae bacterium]